MKALEMAVKMENDAVEFYKKCAEKTNSPIGKKMFLSIAEDEMYHAACAMDVLNGKKFKPPSTSPKQDMKSIYEKSKAELLQKASADASDIEALTIAMKMEKEGYEFYKKSAEAAASAEEKALFSCLANDEQEHFTIFQNTCSLLSDTSNWFMWEERVIYEGG
jgi:rubrerythrin